MMKFTLQLTVVLSSLRSILGSVVPFEVLPAEEPDVDRSKDLTSSFSYNPWAAPLTFDYNTPEPHEKNWIGIWPASGGGPDEGHKVSDHSSAWAYADKSQGFLWLDVNKLPAGDYKAYFLAKDIYIWLAPPVIFNFPGIKATLYFPAKETQLRNARENEEYSDSVTDLIITDGSVRMVSYTKSGGDDWIKINDEGKISGTPPVGCGGKLSIAQIKATSPETTTTTIQIVIMVKRVNERLVDNLSVMTLNLWNSGTHVKRWHEKQLRFFVESRVDLIAVQEAIGDHLDGIAKSLGWDLYRGELGTGIISRYPILNKFEKVENGYRSPGGGVRASLNGNSNDKVILDFWGIHLWEDPYSPKDFCEMSHPANHINQVLSNEVNSERMVQLGAVMKRIAPQIDNSSGAAIPTILAGDFNAPSHLDWIDSLKDKHCGVGSFPWPSSLMVAMAGMDDSYRIANPDPTTMEGVNYNVVESKDPQVRIDFIYGSRDLKVLSSVVTIGGNDPNMKHDDPGWTSDHAAVITVYRLPA